MSNIWSHPIRNIVQKFLYTIKDPEIILTIYSVLNIYCH